MKDVYALCRELTACVIALRELLQSLKPVIVAALEEQQEAIAARKRSK